MAGFSEMQKKIYAYLLSYIGERGYPPSVREIGAAVGLKSPSTVHFHLRRLEEAGLIQRGSGKGRALSLTEHPPEFAGKEFAGNWDVPAKQIPIVGMVAAGSPILAEQHIEGYLALDTDGPAGEYFALRVRGESMRGAGILPGDFVVVRRQNSADSGEIVVALIGDEATVKRLSRRGGKIWLLPENERYPAIDGTYARILGKVTAVVRRY